MTTYTADPTATRVSEAQPSTVPAPPLSQGATVTSLEGRVGRLGVVGAIVGLVLVTAGVTGGGMAGGMEPGAAAGLGAFAGIWSGVGFGFMMGASVAARDH